MGRQSSLDAWLGKFPKERQKEIEQRIRSAPTIRVAHEELKRLGYRKSYDSVQSWRVKDAKGKPENIREQAEKVSLAASGMLIEGNPLDAAMNLALKLNDLCASLTALLGEHQWMEPGDIRLNNREAGKILAALPSLARAASGTIIEMHKTQRELDEKNLMLSLIEEISLDWQKALEGDNPELIPLFESVTSITKARLQLDRSSLLEEASNGK